MAPEDPRQAFAVALAGLRGRLPDLSDEALARRASEQPLPSGRRVSVDARRLGEWLGGRSVPRSFDPVAAVIRTIETVTNGSSGMPIGRWQQLWRAANQARQARQPAPEPDPAQVVVGRPPTDAAALCHRADLASALDAALADAAVRRVLVTGPGGVGKSQLACAAFHRARRGGGVFVWVPASTRTSVLAAYARAWRAVASDGGYGAESTTAPAGWDDEAQADRFVAWLRDTSRAWLVVLDDVDDPADLAGLWPIGGYGRTLVTSRRRDAAVIGPEVRVVPVGMFTARESVRYLRARLSVSDDTGLPELAEALHHFPLALSQAAAYLIDTGTGIDAYRRLLADRRETLTDLFPASSPADGYPGTVATAWRLALDRAGALAPPGTAAALLRLLAVLAPDGIPEAVVGTRAAARYVTGDADRAGTRDTLLALRALHRLSLVHHDPDRGPGSVEVHALVQRAARETDDALATTVAAAADALAQAWSAGPGGYETAAALYRSIGTLRATAGEHLWAGGMHPVLRRVGEFLIHLGRATAARQACGELVAQARTRLGDGHRDVLVLRAQAAQAALEHGAADVAQEELAVLLPEVVDRFGPTDPDALMVRFAEARARSEVGAITGALADLTALVPEATAVLGAYHPLVVDARARLALCHGLAGDAVAARDSCLRLVADLTEGLGATHPSTVIALGAAARWVGETGDLAGAVDLLRRSTDGLTTVVGRLHYETLVTRHNLAYWLALADRREEALAEFAATVRDQTRALDPDHADLLTARVNLAYWRGRWGDPAGRADLAALRPSVERVLGPRHPRALRTQLQLAELTHLAGEPATARDSVERLLVPLTQTVGADHPWTLQAAELLRQWAPTRP